MCVFFSFYWILTEKVPASLSDVFFLPSERREVFSSSSEFVLPLLKQSVAYVFGKADKLSDVFLLGSKL